MYQRISWLEKTKIKSVVVLLTWLLFFVGFIFVNNASAQTLISASPSTQQYAQVSQNGASAFQAFFKPIQSAYEQASQETNQAISDLPQQLERVTNEPQIAIRKQIKDDLENRQDLLENLADKVDDLAEKVQSYNKKSLSSSGGTQEQQNGLSIQQSLENVAQTIDRLADQVEDAKDNSTPAFRTQIQQEIEAVGRALDSAKTSFEAISNPV